jgi:hypothetical protein
MKTTQKIVVSFDLRMCKKFWSKFTHFFCKLNPFCRKKHTFYTYKKVLLTKQPVNLHLKRFYRIGIKSQCNYLLRQGMLTEGEKSLVQLTSLLRYLAFVKIVNSIFNIK